MQLLALALYHRDGRPTPRVVRFQPGALNILTGESETGKSEILDIVDYCLGRGNPSLPDEPIDQTVGWYALLVEFGDSRMLLARPRPAGASTTQAMIRTGGHSLDLPPANELTPNSNVAALRSQLSARLGIEDFQFQPPPGAARSSFAVSIAQAALLCFQNQNEIADKKALFHRQTEDGIAQTLKDTLPYFLGAAGPEQALRLHRLNGAQRELRAAQRKLDDAQRRRDSVDAAGVALLRLAQNEGLLDHVPAAPDAEDIRALLEQALTITVTAVGPSDLRDQRQGLIDERRDLREALQQLDEQLALVDRWQKQGEALTGELHLQLGRLQSINLLGPERDHDFAVCPLCSHTLEEPDASAAEILALGAQVSEELDHVQTIQPIREEHRRALQDGRFAVVERLRVNGAQLRELAASDERMRDLQDQHVRMARVQGRIDQALSAGVESSVGNIRELRHNLHLAQETVAMLQARIDEDDVTAETERRLTDVAHLMTSWAKQLKLGQANLADEVTISLNQLNVVVRRPEGRLPLNRIGSAKNWIGYHMVAHLALHTYLHRHGRPVPGFLMLDQPTQAFFPAKIRDASTVEDADWDTVTAYFKLLREVAELNEGTLQIIVCDHANLTEEAWFQEAIVENWRPVDGQRKALIPNDWTG
ncbi:DUF3732 domain-containing protein [Catenulispora rubra]|uniref:DUF3732 domain-containing protein n=1 Tax=Catenulispora rubra TaxID=280293 RepID=UPI001891F71D|nr:DUF3732 domain-containing protein [Catenulispora rubra]